MYVVAGPGHDEPDTLVWIDKNRLMSSLLEGVQAPTGVTEPERLGASPVSSAEAHPEADQEAEEDAQAVTP